MKSTIGIFAGTFDPVHAGHIAFANQALRQCNLYRVFLMPEPKPRHKPNASTINQRQAWLARALVPHPGLTPLALPGQSFSVSHTLPLLQQRFKGHRLALLLGSDVARSLAVWDDIATLLTSMQLIVALRHNDSQKEVQDLLHLLYRQTGTTPKVSILPSPHPHVSSSLVRTSRFYDHALR